LHESLAVIGEILRQFVELGIAIDLSADVQTALATLVGAWSTHRIPHRHEFERMMNRRDQQEFDALEGVAAILPHIKLIDDLLENIWNKAKAMDDGLDGGVRAFAVHPVLAQRWPNRKAELLDRLRRALVSDQEDEVLAANRGLYTWISAQEATLQQTDAELDDLVREVGIGIAARRLALLRPGLVFTQWLFRKGPERLRHLIMRDCDHGLTALLEEASYARSEQAFDVPEIRAACFRLALSMAAAGFAQERGVTGWLAAAKDDPLPEVRNAEVRKTG
jgi:hypothetical protein